jgi:ADP-ribosylglycohydrolase
VIGSIAGDIIGSVYEGDNVKTTAFAPLFHPRARFTDDTVLTCAVAEHLLDGADLIDVFHAYHARYPRAGYGATFHRWASGREREPYGSWGNGSAMRVSPVAWAFETLEDVLDAAERTAAVTHNHPEGIKGAQAIAACAFLARSGHSKTAIAEYATETFHYDLTRSIAEMRPTYDFDVSCMGSVPQAIRAFLEGDGFESTVRLAISLGGDSDTIACMAGGLSEAYEKGVPKAIERQVLAMLDEPLRALVLRFHERFTGILP